MSNILSTLQYQVGDNETKILAKILVLLNLPWNGQNMTASLAILLQAIYAAQSSGGGGGLTNANYIAFIQSLPTTPPVAGGLWNNAGVITLS